MSSRPPRWNHNLHYHRVILAAVPDGARRSLDVGCGAGMLARDLRRVVPHVTAIDRDTASVEVARGEDDGAGVDYVVGDFLTHPFAPGSFDPRRARGSVRVGGARRGASAQFARVTQHPPRAARCVEEGARA